MRRVILESPYQGDVARNVEYARLCVRDCLLRGESCIASHLLFTQILRDDVADERRLGIAAGLAWLLVADLMALYVDHGISPGMYAVARLAKDAGVPVETRRIFGVDTTMRAA